MKNLMRRFMPLLVACIFLVTLVPIQLNADTVIVGGVGTLPRAPFFGNAGGMVGNTLFFVGITREKFTGDAALDFGDDAATVKEKIILQYKNHMPAVDNNICFAQTNDSYKSAGAAFAWYNASNGTLSYMKDTDPQYPYKMRRTVTPSGNPIWRAGLEAAMSGNDKSVLAGGKWKASPIYSSDQTTQCLKLWSYMLENYGANLDSRLKDFTKANIIGESQAVKNQKAAAYIDLLMSIWQLQKPASQTKENIATYIEDFIKGTYDSDGPITVCIQTGALMHVTETAPSYLILKSVDFMSYIGGITPAYSLTTKDAGRRSSKNYCTGNDGFQGLIADAYRDSLVQLPNVPRITDMSSETNAFNKGQGAYVGCRFSTKTGEVRKSVSGATGVMESLIFSGDLKGFMLALSSDYKVKSIPPGRFGIVADPKDTVIIEATSETLDKPVKLKMEMGQAGTSLVKWQKWLAGVTFASGYPKIVAKLERVSPGRVAGTTNPTVSATNPGITSNNAVKGNDVAVPISKAALTDFINGKTSIEFTDACSDYKIAANSSVTFEYKATVSIQTSATETIVLTPDKGTAKVIFKRGVAPVGGTKPTGSYISEPSYWSEIKNGYPGNETFEAMAGVPTTRNLYFSSGGSEFIVQTEVEYVADTETTRTYRSWFNGCDSEFKAGDTCPNKTLGGQSVDMHNGGTYSKPWSGSIPWTGAASASGWHGGSATNSWDFSAQIAAKAEADAFAASVNGTVLSHTAASDKKTRSKSGWSASVSGGPTAGTPATWTDGKDPVPAVPSSGTPGEPGYEAGKPAVPGVPAKCTQGSAGSYSYTVTWTVPAHCICGSQCLRVLPAVQDTWSQKVKFDHIKINVAKVWKLDKSAVNGMSEITGTDEFKASVIQGDPTIFYHKANQQNSADGRLRYSIEPKQHDVVTWYEGIRSNKDDGIISQTANVNPVTASGHANSWAKGNLYTNNSYSNVLNTHLSNGATNTNYDATADGTDIGTTEWKKFNERRKTLNTVTVVSDLLILQTTSGDQSIMYFQKDSAATECQANYPEVSATFEEMWTNNPKSFAKKSPDAINVGGYNGEYFNPSTKYGQYAVNTVVTKFDSDPAATITRTGKPNKALRIVNDNLDIIDTLPNSSYITGESSVFYKNILNVGAGTSVYDLSHNSHYGANGSEFVSTYSDAHSKVNDIVVHNPVSADRAIVLPLSAVRDQRTVATKLIGGNIQEDSTETVTKLKNPIPLDNLLVNGDAEISNYSNVTALTKVSNPKVLNPATAYAAQIVSDTIPTTMVAGKSYDVSVTVRNTGSNTWTAAAKYRLGGVGDSDPLAIAKQYMGSSDSVGFNGDYTFSFKMTAPTTTGTYISDWRMLREDVAWFGDTVTKSVTVVVDRVLGWRQYKPVAADGHVTFRTASKVNPDWIMNGTDSFEIVTDANNSNYIACYYQDTQGIAGHTYKLTGNLGAHRALCEFRVTAFDASGVELNTFKSAQINNVFTPTPLSITFTAPPGTTRLRTQIYKIGSSSVPHTMSENLFADDVRLSDTTWGAHQNLIWNTDAEELNADGSPVNWEKVVNSGTATFNVRPLNDSWNISGESTFEMYTPGGESYTADYVATAPGVGGHTYALAGLFGEHRCYSALIAYALNASGSILGTYTSDTLSATNVVHTKYVTFTAPVGTASLVVKIHKGGTANYVVGYSEHVFADNIRLYDLNSDVWQAISYTKDESTTVPNPDYCTPYQIPNPDYVAPQAGSTKSFSYTGTIQTFTAPVTGTYKLEVWGAQGGDASVGGSYSTAGGKGGYSTGEITLTENKTVYIYVGGKGTSSTSTTNSTKAGGFNGGGNSPGGDGNYVAAAGGGATDIRLDGTALGNRIIVAGGGGGAGTSTLYPYAYGGYGGGYTGGEGTNVWGSYSGGYGGTQSAGGTKGTNSSYSQNGTSGQGGHQTGNWGGWSGGGGGGGYFGGGSGGAVNAGGGGGSGYTGGVTAGSMTTGTRSGNGYASITSPTIAAVGEPYIWVNNAKYDPDAITNPGGIAGDPTTFNYTGNYQSYVAPTTGEYALEVWGAQGGDGTSYSDTPGLGGYSKGKVTLSAGQTIYIYVGGAGGAGSAGGWNGGGSGGDSTHTGGGGGATDIRTAAGSWSANANTRLIVAGGGGGVEHCWGGDNQTSTYGSDGAGGGLTGNSGKSSTASGYGTGGSQSSAGYNNYSGGRGNGGLGYGGNGSSISTCASGGGGGYYGGGAAFGGNAGGGSGYIGGVTEGSTVNGQRSGNGLAKITPIRTVTLNADTIFNYTGAVQTYTVPETGYYRLEALGASGGTMGTGWLGVGGQGGYTSGTVKLTAGTLLYIYVGQEGTGFNTGAEAGTYHPGGWNGGGDCYQGASGGGGATDFRLAGGVWNDVASLQRRVLVAGAGGGSNDSQSGGAGGSLSGASGEFGSGLVGGGGTQVNGGSGTPPGSFGIGGGSTRYTYADGGAGGGGYYGGGKAVGSAVAGGGGSSFVTGCTGADTTHRSLHGGLNFFDVTLVLGGNIGNGKAGISKIEEPWIEGLSPTISVISKSTQSITTAPDDWYETVIETIKAEPEVEIPNAGTFVPGNFINLDYGFEVYFPNTGDFYGDGGYGLGDVAMMRGKGFVDNMDTTEWTREKTAMFEFNVVYAGVSYPAGSEIPLQVNDADGLYSFYCPLANKEAISALVTFRSYANNGTGLDNDLPNNKSRYSSYDARHSATRKYNTDIVGRIGNMIMEDTGDWRFSNLFKKVKSPLKWLVEGVVRMVDTSQQNNILGSQVDIRGVQVSASNHWLDTYGLLGFANRNPIAFPLSPSKNNINALKSQPLRVGYKSYQDIQTLGNYYSGTVQIIPFYYSLNMSSGSVTPVDIYMDVDGQYKPINIYGAAVANWDPTSVHNNPTTLNWEDEHIRRNYSSVEEARTLEIAAAFKTFDDVAEVWGDMAYPKGKYYTYGNNQLLQLGGRNRTFIGSSIVCSKYDADPTNKFDDLLFGLQAQRWHFTTGLPSSAVAVPAGQPLTQNNIDLLKSNTKVLITALDIKSIGDTFVLQFTGDPNQNKNLVIAGSTFDLSLIRYPIVEVMSSSKSAADDLETRGTH